MADRMHRPRGQLSWPCSVRYLWKPDGDVPDFPGYAVHQLPQRRLNVTIGVTTYSHTVDSMCTLSAERPGKSNVAVGRHDC